jgi:hypothetical protein
MVKDDAPASFLGFGLEAAGTVNFLVGKYKTGDASGALGRNPHRECASRKSRASALYGNAISTSTTVALRSLLVHANREGFKVEKYLSYVFCVLFVF